jgi:hypothetical protein
MARPLTDVLHCELPIQLAPMGCVSVTPALPLAVAGAGGHAVYPALALPPEALRRVLDALATQTQAFGVNFLVPMMDRGSRRVGLREEEVDATAEESVVSRAFNAGMPVAGPHRVLQRSIAAAEALDREEAGIVRLGAAELSAPRFGPMPPTRDSEGAIEAMPFYAGQSAGAVHAVQPAAEIVAELARAVA